MPKPAFATTILRSRSIVSLLTAGFLMLAAASTAQAQDLLDRTFDLDIPPQQLTSAMLSLSRQTGIEVLMSTEMVEDLQTVGVTGEVSLRQALDELLRGHSLNYRVTGERAVSIGAATQGAVAGENTVGKRRPGIEEIIVTGQKKEERIQDVPIAISAFTQEDLTASQIAGGPDLHLQVPNMTFTKTNFTGYSIQIRGIGTQAVSATTDPAVAVALNQTPFIRNRFFEQEFYDMERVEVLRGPQGTLFGRNATAGVVNLITAKPKFQHESMLSYDRGNFNSQRWEAMVNLPVVDDRMALRLAGAGTQRDGYAINEITDSPIDGRDLWSTRASLRFAPNDRLDMTFIWEHFEENDDRIRSGKQLCKKHVVTEVGDIDLVEFEQTTLGNTGVSAGNHTRVQPRFSQGCERASLYSEESFQTPNGASFPYYVPLGAIGLPEAFFDPYASQVQSRDLRTIESTVDPIYTARSDIGQLQLSYQLTDDLTLNSDTAYSTDEVYSLQDFNRFNTRSGAWDAGGLGNLIERGILDENGVFCDPQIGCADRMVAVDISTAASSQFSQEFRISSQFAGPLNFSLGVNYLDYDTEDKYYVFINSLALTALSGGTLNFAIRNIIDEDNPYVHGMEDINSGCLQFDQLPQPDPFGSGGVNCVYIEPNSFENLEDEGHNYFLSKNPYQLESYALFGETYWNITDGLKLTAGLRWSVDKKVAPLHPSQLLIGTQIGHPKLETIEQTWREPTGRLVLDWKPALDFTDETLIYGSIARGYKAGGANPPPFNPPFGGAERYGGITPSLTRSKTFDPEFVNAFELGTKNTLADGAVTLNLAAFYYDYKDYQISEIVDRAAFNRNFDTEVWGLEVETDWWVSENLRLGFKGGYQRTKLGEDQAAVDYIDRTAGGKHRVITDIENPFFNPDAVIPESEYQYDVPFAEMDSGQQFFAYEDWTIVRPFPALPSSCVLPTFLFTRLQEGFVQITDLGGGSSSASGGCEYAYFAQLDPVTALPYEPLPQAEGSLPASYSQWLSAEDGGDGFGLLEETVIYPGWDPATAPNSGDGFGKDVGGNELPNAPRYTATITADYIIPMRGDWIMTAHTDIYWQDEAWWRIFNDHEYNRLEEYFTMNLAAIFANDVSGWNIMLYIKNVTDETAITGGFLGPDDVGLTTNVFLTEPRLFGIRATKRWGDGGGPAQLLGGAGAALLGKEPGEPSPFSLTLGGQLLRPKDSPNEVFAPSFISAFDPNINPVPEQSDDLGWGDGREIVLTYAPENGWRFSLGLRYGESNRDKRQIFSGERVEGCMRGFDVYGPGTGCLTEFVGRGLDENYAYRINYGISDLAEVEEHTLIDFMVGRDVGLGETLTATLSAGLRYAHFDSKTDARLSGQPDWVLPEDCVSGSFRQECDKYSKPAQHHEYDAAMYADREFEGLGPVASWEASLRLLDDARGGHVDLDWTVSGGLLFGKQETSVEGYAAGVYFNEPIQNSAVYETPTSSYSEPFSYKRENDSVTVPTLGAGLGLSYRIGGGKISAGYHWERYFDVIDGGIEERREYDRTVDGPYLKVTFGGG